MRRLRPREVVRSPFALWLDAINCRDDGWLEHAGRDRYDPERVVARWRSWPQHRERVLWWAR